MITRFLPALALVVALLVGAPPTRAANAIEVTSASLTPAITEAQWLLSADFYVPISARLKEVMELGIPVHFVVEFELSRARWYWSDKTLTQRSRDYRLSYHPITRRYRLKFSGLVREFFSLGEAIAAMTRIRGWAVVPTQFIDPDREYEWALRMRLDSGRLPGPLQIDVMNNQDWNLQATWKRFKIRPGTPAKSSATNDQ
ncbi:MAG: DUF4390 domain-containing protein [Burkholderiaceae bacterium]